MLLLFVQEPQTEKRAGGVMSAQNWCARTTLKDNSHNMQQLQGTTTMQTNIIHIFLNFVPILNKL